MLGSKYFQTSFSYEQLVQKTLGDILGILYCRLAIWKLTVDYP